jgi:hypothetical protein
VITFDTLFGDLESALESDPHLKQPYANEPAFERAVWDTLYERCSRHFGEEGIPCALLCSHASLNLPGRSQSEWDKFLASGHADFRIFGANKRVDFAVQHPDGRRIGIEVECFTQANRADAFVIGLGQTLLALGHRDRAILVAHCGSASSSERQALRHIAKRVSEHPHVRVVLLP